MMHGGSASTHIIPASLIEPEQQFAPPPGRLPHPLPPQLPHSSAQQTSLLNTVWGHSPGDTGVVCGLNEGLYDGGFVGLLEGEVYLIISSIHILKEQWY